MLDFTRISFNELDINKPLQAFYNYDLKESEIYNLLEEYATAEEVPKGVSIQKLELCLTNNEQHWVELNKQFTNADEFICLIPNYRSIKL